MYSILRKHQGRPGGTIWSCQEEEDEEENSSKSCTVSWAWRSVSSHMLKKWLHGRGRGDKKKEKEKLCFPNFFREADRLS